jgi:hypothetical protein
MRSQTRRLPFGLKVGYSVFLAILVPIWWVQFGPQNFLWFSDIALLVMLAALWLESRLLGSMMALAALLPELGWNVDFLIWLFKGSSLIGLAGYLEDPDSPAYAKGLSIGFHIILPWLILWTVHRLGYDRRALAAQTLAAWVILPVTRIVSTPEENINWVYGPTDSPIQGWMPPGAWLGLEMIFFPIIIYAPLHLALRRWRGEARRS